MKRSLRPVPFPGGFSNKVYMAEYKRLTKTMGYSHADAVVSIRNRNLLVRNQPLKGEKCGAYSRHSGKGCTYQALANGRCARHGGINAPDLAARISPELQWLRKNVFMKAALRARKWRPVHALVQS